MNSEQIVYMTEWAARWGATLQLNGSVGFGRDCVGILHGSAYLDYGHMYDLDPQPEFWAPDDAYHKHDCLSVLYYNDDRTSAIEQLYRWVKWLDDHGWTVEVGYRKPAHELDAVFHGLSLARLMPPAQPTKESASEPETVVEPETKDDEDEDED